MTSSRAEVTVSALQVLWIRVHTTSATPARQLSRIDQHLLRSREVQPPRAGVKNHQLEPAQSLDRL